MDNICPFLSAGAGGGGSRVDLLDDVLHRKLDNDLHRLAHLLDLHLL